MEGVETEPTLVFINLLRGKAVVSLAGVLPAGAILECPWFRRTPLIGLTEHSIWNGSHARETEGSTKPYSPSLECQNTGLASACLGFPILASHLRADPLTDTVLGAEATQRKKA